MNRVHRLALPVYVLLGLFCLQYQAIAQNLPPRYPTLELFTNTPCPSCGSQNPGLFSRLANFEGQYHLISFYPGRPYNSCIFYNANIPENTARWQFYTGEVFGTPTVAINGIDFKNSSGVNNTVLNDITGNTSWLEIKVEETPGSTRQVDITLEDHAGGSLTTGLLFAVIVEKEIQYNAPNGETLHHNVFRKFLTATAGDEVDLSGGSATASYSYDVDPAWDASQTYVITWLMDPVSKEIYNSGTRFDPDFVTAVEDVADVIDLQVYPNPTRGHFAIRLPDAQHPVTVQVYDITGTMVLKRDYAAQAEIMVDGSAWPEGQYILRVNTASKEGSDWVRIVR